MSENPQKKKPYIRKYTLREARKQRTKLKIYEVAEMIGVTATTLGKWERMESFPNSIYLDPLCEIYGIYRGQLIIMPREELIKKTYHVKKRKERDEHDEE